MGTSEKTIVFCIIVILSVSGVFYFAVGINQHLSESINDWAAFGGYFGGVAAPLLSFISIILILQTIHSQRIAAQKQDLLAYVSKAEEDVDSWLKRRLAVASIGSEKDTVEFGDVVWGIADVTYVNKKEFTHALEHLLKLTCKYSESISLYQDNINTYFVIKHHRMKAQDILGFIKHNNDSVNPMAPASIQACFNLLDGKHN